jgi:hypothetical protein
VRATGIGSLPGLDVRDSAAIVAGELSSFLHLVELPARGPGADIVGRTAGQVFAACGEFSVQTTPDGWRITDGLNREMRRAQSWWNEDCDALELSAQGFRGDVKIQVCGPWTIAAQVELASGERMVSDRGACLELAEALAMTCASLVTNIRTRVPDAHAIYVQCDEPSLAAVTQGALRTASGFGRHAPVLAAELEPVLGRVLDAITQAGGIPGVHACAKSTPWDVVTGAGAAFVSFDALNTPMSDEALGVMWERGIELFFGTVPSMSQPGTWNAITASAPIRAAGHRLGIDQFSNVVVTPTCGLAGADPTWARTAYGACQAASALLQGESDESES